MCFSLTTGEASLDPDGGGNWSNVMPASLFMFLFFLESVGFVCLCDLRDNRAEHNLFWGGLSTFPSVIMVL